MTKKPGKMFASFYKWECLTGKKEKLGLSFVKNVKLVSDEYLYNLKKDRNFLRKSFDSTCKIFFKKGVDKRKRRPYNAAMLKRQRRRR